MQASSRLGTYYVQYSACAGFMKTYVHIFWNLGSMTNRVGQPTLANSACGVLAWHRMGVRGETRWRRVPHTTTRTVLLISEGPGGGQRGPAAGAGGQIRQTASFRETAIAECAFP